MPYRLISFAGLLAMIGIAWLLSENRRRVDWRLVISALALQFALAVTYPAAGKNDFDR